MKKGSFFRLAVLLVSLFTLVFINVYLEMFDATESKRVLVIGTAKSGTTAAYKSIKDAMGQGAITFFEPEASEFDTAIASRNKEVLVKLTLLDRSLYIDLDEKLKSFDKRVMIIRDLRDILVSNLLYNIRWMRFSRDPERFDIFMNALRMKEEDPQSISVVELYALRNKLESEVIETWENIRSWQDEHHDFDVALRMVEKDKSMYVLRYKDYVDNNLNGLSEYLELNVEGGANVNAIQEKHSIKKSVRNIARTKKYDNWKNWFTQKDIQVFRPLISQSLNNAGIEDDWSLNDRQEIKPEHSSEYVKRIVEETKITW